MDLEIIILSEVSQKEKDKLPYNITYMWNQNMILIYEQKQIHIENRLVIIKGERERAGVWNEQVHTIIYRMDKQQGPTV